MPMDSWAWYRFLKSSRSSMRATVYLPLRSSNPAAPNSPIQRLLKSTTVASGSSILKICSL